MPRLRFRSLLLTALASLTLCAQVDPKLQASATDVLDIYGGTKNSTRPEVITLIDQSGSTQGIAWDSRYYTNTRVNWHLPAATSKNFAHLFGLWDAHNTDPTKFTNDDNDRGSFRVVAASTALSDLGISFSVRYIAYNIFSGSKGNYALLREGILIKPNGSPVLKSDVAASTDANLWVQQASHVRFAITSKQPLTDATYSYGGVNYPIPDSNCGVTVRPFSGGNYEDAGYGTIQGEDSTRVIDIPLPWAVFDRVPNQETGANHRDHTGTLKNITGAPSYLHLNDAINNKHPQHMYLFDPVWKKDPLTGLPVEDTGKSQWYEIETTWWETESGGFGGNVLDANGYFKGFDISTDYMAWAFFGQDMRNQAEKGAYRDSMVDAYRGDNTGDYTVADVREGGAGFLNHTRDSANWTGNGLPQMTRFQAIKYAIIRTWIEQQDSVWWGIRFLNYCGQSGGFKENGRGSAADCFQSANLVGNPGDRKLLHMTKPSSSTNPDVNLRYIQVMQAGGSTPLTFGLLNTYAQLASPEPGNSGSIFNENKTETPIPSCRKSFVVVLSDGNPNDNDDKVRAYDDYLDRYVEGTDSVTVREWNSTTNSYDRVTYNACDGANGKALGTGDYWKGGGENCFAAGPAAGGFAPKGSHFNIWSLSGMTAHMSFSSLSGAPTDRSNSVTLPFRVTSRPSGTTRRISTMTIGVSMAGRLFDTDGAKAAMYRTALYGWESRHGFDASNLPLPYDENDPSRNDKVKNPYFFDAQSPEGIAQALKSAFDAARSVTNTMSAPVAPMLGLGVGNQMYFGTFTSGETGQAIWKGDLLMTGLRVVGNATTLIGRNGTDVLDTVSPTNAIWSASAALQEQGWKGRVLYTLTPELKSATDPTPTGKFLKDLLLWDESTSKTALPNSILNVTSDAERLSLIRFMMGANKAAQQDAAALSSELGHRDDIMGAIINSTPAILSFPVSMAPSSLTSKMGTEYPGATITAKRFRLIIVGDNQGILHGFGELAGQDSSGVLCAVVKELWGIIPPDILGGLQTWRNGTKFRYLMDGSPTVYVQEKGTPNGVIDSDGTNTDVVRVMVGLRKGGRSYYTLSFTNLDPSKPYIAWMIRPDESTDPVISKMGFSTSTPAAARVQVDDIIRDVFFVGGGLSTKEVDDKYGFKLGRSILAIRAVEDTSGNPVVLKSWDYSADTTDKGSIPAAIVPTEVILKSNKAQRAYFSTAFGQVYALGNKVSSGSRTDTADIKKWELRAIFKSKFGGQSNGSAPTVFNMPYGYPVDRDSAPKERVPAVGVAFGLGDRNDPMDQDALNAGGITSGSGTPKPEHRMIMILDRQDSASISTTAGYVDEVGYNEDSLADLTAITSATAGAINPSDDGYYLRTKSGYRLEYKERSVQPGSTDKWYYEKTVTTPIVLNKALVFTKFAPNVKADQCSGAGGTSYVYRMCDVINPVFSNGTVSSSSSMCSGIAATFNDIPSEPGGVGLSSVMVVGEYVPPTGTGGTGTVDPTSIPTNPITALTRPRAWRIVR